ncbi:hypothetical protein [uncultured Nonlabens sp.]|uniref:hypothetical protein n=1 Tax=uncultured Nonlabens sp. TaxID=859306 RepID=UPI002616B77D|nr:hypothetical protein [uncultured Nonlabens sp.]
MKNFIAILTIIVFSTSCISQTNDLSVLQYQNIKFDGNLITDIIDTRGSLTQLNQYFNESFNHSTYNEPSYTVIYNTISVELTFKDGERDSNNLISDYQLTNLKLKDSSKSLFINGIALSVGDNINILGAVNSMNDPSTRQKKVVFRIGSEVIRISFNRNTNVITLIEYEYFN